MAYFNDICFLKAPQAFDIPHPQDVSDLTEICYLASAVEKDVNSVKIPVDFHGEAAFEDFDKYLKTHTVDLVGISSMTGAFKNAIRLAEIAKRASKYVVMGGYHPTALPRDVLKSPYVDAVIIGEGEATFRDLVLNGPSREVAGMAIKENGEVIFTGARPLIKELNALPHPLRSARPTRFGEVGDDYSIDTVYTSRGCPWSCTFCANDMVNKQWRARSPENVVEELAMLHDPKRRKLIKMWDANFLTDVKRIEKLCDLMIERDLTNFKIWTETRVEDIVRAEGILGKLYRVGLRNVSLGIESPNAETLKLMNKKNKDDACVKAVDILLDHKIKAQGYFIIGHYNETIEDTKRYPEFAKKLKLRQAIFMVMTPYPGTTIYEEFKRENKIISSDWDRYNNFCTVVETKEMDNKTLKKMYAYCWGRFNNNYSFLKKETFFDMAVVPMLRIAFLYEVFKVDKANSREDIKDYIYESVKAGTENLSREYFAKPPLALKWFKEITIRIRHSQYKNIDFLISQNKDKRRIVARESSKDKLINGFIIDLKDAVKLGERIPGNRLVSILCKGEILKSLKHNPVRRLKYALSYIADKEVIETLFYILLYVAPIVTKGLLSSAMSSIASFTNTIPSQQ